MNPSVYQSIRNQFNFEKKVLPTLLHLFYDFSLVACLSLLVQFASPWLAYPFGCLGVAVLLFRNFSLMHDAVHGAVLFRKTPNDLVGIYAGTLCLLPFENWKKIHLEHHKWAGNIDKDPSMSLVKIYPNWPVWLQNSLSLMWKAWIPSLAFLQYIVFWFHSLRFAHKESKNKKLLLSLVVPIVFWSFLLYWIPPTFMWASLIPGLGLYLVAVEVVNFPHHLELPQMQGDQKLPLYQQHSIARTCLYPKWFAKYVVLNFNYHIEHHMYPNVPWYYLDKIHHHTQSELGASYNTDPQFAWILKNRPKNLHDVLTWKSEVKPEYQPDLAA